MFKFGAGGLPALITQTQGLFLVVLRQCLSDFTIQLRPGWCFFVCWVLGFEFKILVFDGKEKVISLWDGHMGGSVRGCRKHTPSGVI
jgi:hypothetical protein